MADEKNTNDQTDDIYDEGQFEDDGTADIIREIISNADKEEGVDDGGFDQPFEEPKVEEDQTISAEEGHSLIDEADRKRSTRGADKKDEAAAKDPDKDTKDEKDGEKEPEKDQEPEKKETEEKDPEEAKTEKDDEGADPDKAKTEDEGEKIDLETAGIDALLDGVPDDRKGEVSRRLKEADAALAPFQSEYVQNQMKHHGATPVEVANRLTQLAQFAQEKPDEYIAWAASEMAASPEKIGEVLSAAAKHLGYKVVKEDEAGGEDDDDPFMTDRERELLKENRELREQNQSGKRSFGPDTPERQQVQNFQTQMNNFVNEIDESGQPKRPMFNHLQPVIAARANAQKQQTGQNVTFDDLDRIYNDVVAETRSKMGVPDPAQNQADDPASNPAQESSAANSEANMASDRERKAAAAEKAMRASKSVDGSGQGASRRPALPDTDDPTDVIRALVGQHSD